MPITLRKIALLLLITGFVAPFSASAAMIQEIQQQLQALQAQLLQLQQSSPAAPTTIPSVCQGITFDRNLTVGSRGADVVCLQALLRVEPQSGYFGKLTLAAVRAWQTEHGLVAASQAGPQTRLILNALLVPQSVAPTTPTVLPPTLLQPTLSVEDVVKKALPASVSIIISQDAQQYQVVYENPFGNEWGFRGVDILVPVYKPTGLIVQRQIGAGSGFIVDHRGYIVTNNHVVYNPNANYTVLMADGTQHLATVVYRDASHDLAIIKMEGNDFPVESLGDSASLAIADQIVVLGNAFGENPNTVSTGLVSGFNQTVQADDAQIGTETLTGIIQTTAPIHPGNSGGPMVDMHGNVVGVIVAMDAGSTNISFAIPISEVKKILQSLAL